ncbi:MAG: hypothetical protein K2N74_01610, partial [Clostridiales bacterium]|nr:hypothetical protein [Clostridiales bacterium]
STYDGTAITLPHAYTDIFTLSSAAITDKYDLGGGRYANTAGVGKYPIIGTNDLDDYYDIAFVGAWNTAGAYKSKAGVYEITPATLDMSDIDGFDIYYDEQEHGLVVTDKSNDPTEVIATAVDGSTVTVVYYESDSIVADFDEAALAALGTGSSVMPKYIDAGSYYVVYKVTAANHKTEADCCKLIIKRTQNSFTTDFAFANGKQFASNVASIADGDAAWVYGLYGEHSTDGYNKDGDQAVTEPIAKFNRLVGGATNALSFRLSYSTELKGTYSTVLNNKPSAAAIFADGFNSGAFKAGYYKLTAGMSKADPNYDALSVTWVFRVVKRNLTVTAEDISVMFGEEVTADMIVGKYDGLVLNSTATGANVDTITDAIGDTLSITTDYNVGDEVGDEYVITVSGGQSVNYNVTYNNAELTVTPREVTITIDNKENTYNLQNGETGQTLTFKIVGSTLFYDIDVPSLGIYNNTNQSIIALYTDALTNVNSNVGTNDVIIDASSPTGIGGYAIYAKYASEFAQKNYIIKFASCAMSDTRDGAILQDGANNAGKYTIKQATFNISGLGVYHKVDGEDVKSNYYSGAQNFYKAQLDNPDVEISFTYSKNGKETQDVIDVGEYTAYASTDNTNYTAGGASFIFQIQRTTLTLTADDTTIEYGTPTPTTATADRFGGFRYTASSVV